MDIDKAIATQLANIEKRTGKTLAQLTKIVKGSGLTKHGELVAMLKSDLGMGHGDANTLVHHALKSDGTSAAAAAGKGAADVLDDIYTGPKARLAAHSRRADGVDREIRRRSKSRRRRATSACAARSSSR